MQTECSNSVARKGASVLGEGVFGARGMRDLALGVVVVRCPENRIPLSGFRGPRIVRHPTLGQIPVVICSGKKTLCDFVWATKCGAAGFVVKPLDDAKDLVRTIRAAVKNAQQGSRLDLVL